MSFQRIYPFTDPLNYDFDPSLIEVAGGIAKLKIKNNPDQEFIQNFDDDTGFIYNPDLIEFAAGEATQKDQRPENATSAATYTNNINLNWGGGSLTGAATGGASVSNGKLDLSFNDTRYVDYDPAGNADSTQQGCVRFILTPNYSGTPVGRRIFFCVSRTPGDVRNAIVLSHNSGDGNLNLIINSFTGGTIISQNLGIWNPTAGQDYEIELNWDIDAGATRVFIDGVQFGATQTGTGTRNTSISVFRIGTDYNDFYNSDFKLDNLIVFSEVQHTANYTPGYTIPENIYSFSSLILPEMEYTGPGSLIVLQSLLTTQTGTPRYTIQVGQSGDYLYFNGSDWIVSDGTYDQANDLSTFNSNIGSISVLLESIIQIKILFPTGNTQNIIDLLTMVYTGQDYPVSDPTIEPNDIISMDSLDLFEETAEKTGSEIKYILKKGDNWYYWNVNTWEISNESYAQSNTAAEIEANKSAFLSANENVRIRAFLHSDDGSSTPELNQILIQYNDHGGIDTINKCSVYGIITTPDKSQAPPFTVELEKDVVLYKNTIQIKKQVITVTPNADNYWNIELIETDNMEGEPRYIFKFPNEIFRANIADVAAKAFNDLKNLDRTAS